MKSLPKVLRFNWDRNNIDKNRQKHDILPKEAESVFINEEAIVFADVKHSEREDRFVILGRSQEQRNLFIIFTFREEKIRVVSVRRMHRKEVEKYEKAKKSAEI